MAKFLTTRKAGSELEDLIRSAGDTLILISPYLKLSKDFRERLIFRDKQNKRTTIIYGKQELSPEEHSFISSLRLVMLKYYRDLHAKCYVNDQKMIITSLNFYEYSLANNKEMGILIDKNDPSDASIFAEAMEEVHLILASSEPSGIGAVRPLSKTKQANPTNAVHGYCIRTGIAIPFNPEKPLCYDAYLVWNEYGNIDYPEQFCHFSGEPSKGETSVAYPIMKKNWNKAKQAHGF